MKQIVLSLVLATFFISCGKEDVVPADEIPGWLQDIIQQNEEELESNNKSAVAITAWARFTYLEEYYFEYHNPILSSLPPVYDWEGNEVQFDQASYEAYQNEKCCMKYVWRGPSYFNGGWP